ncbi:MAG: DUF885 family protein [Deltaproteobacteria bacterium]|nr:MAG: DUF885 family protein [Deltaproteobacteria bacterium]
MANEIERELSRIADEYFSLLAASFPIMCASDEFQFLPRVQSAAQFLDRMDDLSPGAIATAVETVRDLQAELKRQPAPRDFEEEIDRQLLLHNMAGILIELEEVRSWRHNPLLYLKIACIGVDQALNKPCSNQEERFARTAERLHGLHRLLEEAGRNLENIPAPYYKAALVMSGDATQYLEEIARDLHSERNSTGLHLSCKEAQESLSTFAEQLRVIGPASAESVTDVSVEKLLKRHYGCPRPLEEIFAIAKEEWQRDQEEMEQLRRVVNPKLEWQQLYKSYKPAEGDEADLFGLYGSEIASLRKFCLDVDMLASHSDQQVVLAETPSYLRSVRSAASYSSPLGVDPRERAYFYITSGNACSTSQLDVLRRQRLHREYRFLSAHETYPGHHLLDSIRRRLDNPVRRQIESPLFYEGWAYYAESILIDSGYVEETLERLVDCKRRLWRAARCLIDTGLALQRISTEEAASLLVSVGFGADEAMSQVERFRLNPGYQLCYSLGKYEILNLRQHFLPKLGWQRFHRLLLEGGELPFHLVAWRLENLIGSNGEEALAKC